MSNFWVVLTPYIRHQANVLLASIACFLPLLVVSLETATSTTVNVTAHLDGLALIVLLLVRFSLLILETCLSDHVTECDSLADGDHRRPRQEGESCKCKDGWGGINCNGTCFFMGFALHH